VQFKAYQRDTLSGIYIYFNSTVDSGNFQTFKLAVWKDKNNEPGDELYMESEQLRFDSLNSFVHYKLTRPIPINEGEIFYVGWVQQTSAMLNVGFDVNNLRWVDTAKVNGKMYVSHNGYTWEPSSKNGQGVIMIRPSFAKWQLSTSVAPRKASAQSITVYPNPVHGELYLDLPDALREKTLRLEIFDFSGKRVMLREAAAGSSVNVAQLVAGNYLVRFNYGGSVVGYAKFIKM
jgi:hypothetical protein